jgi:NAD(P)-dependent dehydrogenase (short-subunit alcohol dehydrogenase family)
MDRKVVVVTGAGGALGRAVVKLARAQGARIAQIDRGAGASAATADLLEVGGVDLSDGTQASRAITAVAAHYGAIDVLVNAAGAFAFEGVVDGNIDAWDRMHRLNLLTALNAARAAVPHLVRSGSGRIINIGAIGALHAGAGMGPYAASKSGVHRLTEALAVELKGRVTVNAVLPSIIDTAMNRQAMPQADFATWVSVDEVASVIMFLASTAASGITGALIPVAGRV